MPSGVPSYTKSNEELGTELRAGLGDYARHVDINWFVENRPPGVQSMRDIPIEYLQEAVKASLYVSRRSPLKARRIEEPDAAEVIARDIQEGLSAGRFLYTAIQLALSEWILLDEEICEYREQNVRAREHATVTLMTLVLFCLPGFVLSD